MSRILSLTIIATMCTIQVSAAAAATTIPPRAKAVQTAFGDDTMAQLVTQRTKAAEFRTRVLTLHRQQRMKLRLQRAKALPAD